MEIRPTKEVKGQGLTKMLAKGNERVLGLEEEGGNNMVYVILDDLEHHHWYSDIVYHLKNLTCPNGLADHQRRDLRLKTSRYYINQGELD